MKSVLLMTKRKFYDPIVDHRKNVEIRGATDRWLKLLGFDPHYEIPSIAVFQCGRLSHRRKILSMTKLPLGNIAIYTPIPFLDQDRKKLGLDKTNEVILIRLGEDIKNV